MTAEEFLKSATTVVSDFKKESGVQKDREAVSGVVAGLMLFCSQNDIEFEDVCDAASSAYERMDADLSGAEDDDDEDEEADEEEEEETEEEDEDEEDEDEEDEDFDDSDNGDDDDEAFDDGDEDEE